MVAKVYKYADGGKVVKSEGGARQPPAPKITPRPDTIQSPKADSAADAIKNQRARQMKELGLKDGGVVPKAKLPGPETRRMPPLPQLPKPKTAAEAGRKYRDGGAVPNMKAPLGQGGRFAAVSAAAKRGGAKNPDAVAAVIGRKKYGAKKMAKMAAAGRKRRS